VGSRYWDEPGGIAVRLGAVSPSALARPRLRQAKARAGRVRIRLHPPAGPPADGDRVHHGSGNWDIPGLIRWNARVEQPRAPDTRDVPGDDITTELRSALRDAGQKITTLNGRLGALAAVTANLYRENQALRAALDHRTQLAPLPGKEGH
jgi:hypothetical protein